MKIQLHIPTIVSVLLMLAVLLLIYPHYQYYVDPDGTAYLTISKRYAAGNFDKAINGYWSPWACWLTALLIKAGLAAIPAAVLINTLGATGFLLVTQSFFIRCKLARELRWMLSITLALFLCYAIFWQSFDDLWECFFLLLALRLFMARDFKRSPPLWVACGLIGALAYFAKAYAFPFFILNTVVCLYVICPADRKQWLKISSVVIGCMIIFSLPWIWLLHRKYGIWTTSTAGTLNTSWYLVGHPQWKNGIDVLIPPTYGDSPYYWEDPYFANGKTPHFWDSASLAGLQALRLGYNLIKFLISMLQLSMLLPVVFFLLFSLVVILVKYKGKMLQDFPNDAFIIGVSFVLFPVGYLLVNFEPRYLWYMLSLGMTLGAVNIQNIRHELRRFILAFVFPLTFIIYPVRCMKQMYDEGRNEQRAAAQLSALNIHGTFTAMANPGTEAQRMERLAYFSGNPFYSVARRNILWADVLRDMRRYKVKYFFCYGEQSKTVAPADEQGKPLPEITNDGIGGLKVFVVNP